jgi:hypothetical protein
MIEAALAVLTIVAIAAAGLTLVIAAKLARIERRLDKIEVDRRLENDRRIRELLKAIPPRAERGVAAE